MWLSNYIRSPFDGAGGLQRQVEALATAAKLRREGPQASEQTAQLNAASLNSIFGVLQQQANAIARLQNVLARNKRDLALLEESRTSQEAH